MADAISEALGVEVVLEKGHGGVFEVSVGTVVVAKKGLDGFPTPETCVEAVRAAL